MSNGPQVSLSAPAYGGASPPSRFNMAAHALASGEDGKTAIRIFSGADPEAPPREITYARLRARVCAVAAGLGALALPARSVIAIRQNTGIDYAVCYLAIAGAGHVALALSPMLTVRETRTICETAGVAAVIRDEALDLHDVTEGIHLVRLEEVEALGRDSGAAGAQALAATAAGIRRISSSPRAPGPRPRVCSMPIAPHSPVAPCTATGTMPGGPMYSCTRAR